MHYNPMGESPAAVALEMMLMVHLLDDSPMYGAKSLAALKTTMMSHQLGMSGKSQVSNGVLVVPDGRAAQCRLLRHAQGLQNIQDAGPLVSIQALV